MGTGVRRTRAEVLLICAVLFAVCILKETWCGFKLRSTLSASKASVQARLPKLESQLFAALLREDSVARDLYGKAIEKDRVDRRRLDRWREQINERAKPFEGQVIGHESPGGSGNVIYTPEWQRVQDEYRSQEEAVAELDRNKVETRREIALERGGKVRTQAVARLWQERESLVARSAMLTQRTSAFDKTVIGWIVRVGKVLCAIVLVVLVIAVILVICQWFSGW
jgi:hypothetical protein